MATAVSAAPLPPPSTPHPSDANGVGPQQNGTAPATANGAANQNGAQPTRAEVDGNANNPHEAWNMRQLREATKDWTLASDHGFLLYLQEFSDKLLKKSRYLEGEVDDLVFAAKCAEVRLHNTFNSFLVLSDGQFIENRVYMDNSYLNGTKADPAAEEAAADDHDAREQVLLPKFVDAVACGMILLPPEKPKEPEDEAAADDGLHAGAEDDGFDDNLFEDEESDLSAGDLSDVDDDEDDGAGALIDSEEAEALPASAQALMDKAAAEGISATTLVAQLEAEAAAAEEEYVFADRYEHRPLPFVIGTRAFLEDELCGLTWEEDESEDGTASDSDVLEEDVLREAGALIDSDDTYSLSSYTEAESDSANVDGVPPPKSGALAESGGESSGSYYTESEESSGSVGRYDSRTTRRQRRNRGRGAGSDVDPSTALFGGADGSDASDVGEGKGVAGGLYGALPSDSVGGGLVGDDLFDGLADDGDYYDDDGSAPPPPPSEAGGGLFADEGSLFDGSESVASMPVKDAGATPKKKRNAAADFLEDNSLFGGDGGSDALFGDNADDDLWGDVDSVADRSQKKKRGGGVSIYGEDESVAAGIGAAVKSRGETQSIAFGDDESLFGGLGGGGGGGGSKRGKDMFADDIFADDDDDDLFGGLSTKSGAAGGASKSSSRGGGGGDDYKSGALWDGSESEVSFVSASVPVSRGGGGGGGGGGGDMFDDDEEDDIFGSSAPVPRGGGGGGGGRKKGGRASDDIFADDDDGDSLFAGIPTPAAVATTDDGDTDSLFGTAPAKSSSKTAAASSPLSKSVPAGKKKDGAVSEWNDDNSSFSDSEEATPVQPATDEPPIPPAATIPDATDLFAEPASTIAPTKAGQAARAKRAAKKEAAAKAKKEAAEKAKKDVDPALAIFDDPIF